MILGGRPPCPTQHKEKLSPHLLMLSIWESFFLLPHMNMICSLFYLAVTPFSKSGILKQVCPHKAQVYLIWKDREHLFFLPHRYFIRTVSHSRQRMARRLASPRLLQEDNTPVLGCGGVIGFTLYLFSAAGRDSSSTYLLKLPHNPFSTRCPFLLPLGCFLPEFDSTIPWFALFPL